MGSATPSCFITFICRIKKRLWENPISKEEEHGIFAIRSPHRPNHIGLSVVKTKKIEDNRLYFTEVDILDGTPLLDIKPYAKHFDSRNDAVDGWIEKHFKDGLAPERTTVASPAQ